MSDMPLMPTKTLILFSGGVESTSILKYFLTETKNEVYSHFIRMINPEKRVDYEIAAVNTLIPILQEIRPFTYSTSDISICAGQALPNDIKVLMMIGSAAMYHHNCTEMYVGCSTEDRDIRTTVNGVHTVIARPDTWWQDFQQLLQPNLKPNDKAEDVLPYHFTGDWPKKQHMEYLGDLLPLTWSCRRPVNGKVCGRCHSCLERNG
jgi:hypothetical protein